jgi:hypothetical protein
MSDVYASAVVESNRRISHVVAGSVIEVPRSGVTAELTASLYALATTAMFLTLRERVGDIPQVQKH